MYQNKKPKTQTSLYLSTLIVISDCVAIYIRSIGMIRFLCCFFNSKKKNQSKRRSSRGNGGGGCCGGRDCGCGGRCGGGGD